jgi:hypothetical protein
MLLFSVKNENIIYYPLFSVTFSSTKYKQELTELSRRVAIARRWRGAFNLLNCLRLIGPYLNHIPSEFHHFERLVGRLTLLALDRWLPRNEGLHY